MKNIFEILKGFGIEIPEDKRADLDKALLENYKTVAEAEKLRIQRDNYKGKSRIFYFALKNTIISNKTNVLKSIEIPLCSWYNGFRV